MGAYLAALAPLLPPPRARARRRDRRRALLEVLAPVYERVVAVDRSGAQLARARERIAARGFANITLVEGELDSEGAPPRWRPAAPTPSSRRASFITRPQPGKVVAQLAALCAPGGALVVIDYARHDDESMREQADAWLGFEPAELRRFARAAEPRGRAHDEDSLRRSAATVQTSTCPGR